MCIRDSLTTIGSYSLVSRLLDGEFLDYQAAIPQGYTTQVTVSTRELIAAVDRASLIISDRLRSPLRLRFEEDSLRITCTTSLGKAYDEVPCHCLLYTSSTSPTSSSPISGSWRAW